MKVYTTKTKKSNPGIVLLYVPEKVSESNHQLYETLRRKGMDLFFIFSSSRSKYIDPSKFSNLYEATWYGISEGEEDKTRNIWEALDYITEFGGYTSISVILSSWVKEDSLDQLKRLQQSLIENSVFSSRSLNREEKSRIYTIKETLIEILGKFRYRIPKKTNNLGSYSIKTSEDNIFFIRPKLIREIRKDLDKEILKSFEGSDFGVFITSRSPENLYINLKTDEAKI